MRKYSIPSSWVYQPLWMGMYPAYKQFLETLEHPQIAQQQVLQRLQKTWSSTRREKNNPLLAKITKVENLCEIAPIVTYDDIRKDIEEIANGTQHVWSNQPVVRFERSGGSSGARKLLPFTPSFIQEMNRALLPWLFDMFKKHPMIKRGPAYWSVSPLGMHESRTMGGIPIGAEDDAAYFIPILRTFIQKIFATPSALARLPDVASCHYVTLRLLLQTPSLAMISVWSPTFLIQLLEALERNREFLVADLEKRTCRVPLSLFSEEKNAHNAEWHRRVQHVCNHITWNSNPSALSLLQSSYSIREVAKKLWPQLSMISMWGDADSNRFVKSVTDYFPGVAMQEKGLLATEGVISIPFGEENKKTLAVNSHILEFRHLNDPSQKIYLPHELELNHEYEVILTTGAGLLRYALGDRVRVTGFMNATPCVEFIGRGTAVSDMVGEKLSEAFVAEAIQKISSEESIYPTMVCLVAGMDPGPHYDVVLDGLDEVQASRFVLRLDRALQATHAYAYARQLGQLGPLAVRRTPHALDVYVHAQIQLGRRAGDIKPPVLLGLSQKSPW